MSETEITNEELEKIENGLASNIRKNFILKLLNQLQPNIWLNMLLKNHITMETNLKQQNVLN